MPKIIVNNQRFPHLFAKYNDIPNFEQILTVITESCDHFFDVDALEIAVQKSPNSQYFKRFDVCVKKIPNDFYTSEEILPILANHLFDVTNSMDWAQTAFYVPDTEHPSKKQQGFYEKVKIGVLESKLDDPAVVNQFAFSTIDMCRSARSVSPTATVLELRHLPLLSSKPCKLPLYVRCPSNGKSVAQWVLIANGVDGSPYIYSESPLQEDDKLIVHTYLEKNGFKPKEFKEEGGTSALSVSSGIRAVSRLVEQVGGAGLSSGADYPSLIVEWVWLTSSYFGVAHTTDYLPGHFSSASFDWQYFRSHMLQASNDKFTLMGINQSIGSNAYNDHLQMRSYALGIDWLLENPQLNILSINKEKGEVTLVIPEDIKVDSGSIVCKGVNLAGLYSSSGLASKARYGFPTSNMNSRGPSSGVSSEAVASAFILNVFRACAKQKTLSITLPLKWKLDKTEIALICYLMETNPFVCELKIPNKHPSLVEIKNNLQHIFARNRWLSMNGYLPPLLDNFWDIAAQYWVSYLAQPANVLFPNAEGTEFKRCVDEMGIHGLKAVLAYLTREEHTLKPDFAKLLLNKELPPTFYAGCPAKEMRGYTELLLAHLKNMQYFPFAHFQLGFVPGANQEIIDLISALNKLETFERISLTNCITPDNLAGFSKFIDAVLAHMEKDENWTCPISVPELDAPSNDANVNKVRMKYMHMNNILLNRMRTKHNKDLDNIPLFKKALEADNEAIDDDLDDAVAPAEKGKVEKNKLSVAFNHALGRLERDEFPISRAGGLSLQMQQQQQIKQERSRRLDNETKKGTAYQDVLPANLITYENIDELLGEFYAEHKKDHPVDESKATLGENDKHILKRFFHTWINANPDVSAPHIIRKMTPIAAKMLIKHHRQLSGGLNPYNLPKGFYTQRTAAGDLVLGYKVTLGYTTDHNPLTLKLSLEAPKAELFLGDFRQFDMKKYTAADIQWDDADYQYLKLFCQVQPRTKEETEAKYNEFAQQELENLTTKQRTFFNKNKETICDNWDLFYSLFFFQKDEGITEFMQLKDIDALRIDEEDAIKLLLRNIKPDNLRDESQDFFSNISFDASKPLAQIYFQYGDYGLNRFAVLMSTMQNQLGRKFTQTFARHYLSTCATFSPLLQESALVSMDKMIAVCSSDPFAKALWLVFIERQKTALGWTSITELWDGFSFFYDNIKNMELHEEFKPEHLSAIRPDKQNMFVCLDRILLSLMKIPNQEQRKQLLRNIDTMDMTEGGLPYAVRHDEYVTIDQRLELHDFTHGTPTYSVDLSDLFKWQGDIGLLYMQRALAAKGHFNYADYQTLANKITDTSMNSKYQLLWSLHTDWNNAEEFLDSLDALDGGFVKDIAEHFHHVFYVKQHPSKQFPLEVFKRCVPHQSDLAAVINKYPDSITLFECLAILQRNDKLDNDRLVHVFNLFKTAPAGTPHLDQGLLLASVYRASPEQLAEFYNVAKTLKGITRNEMVILVQQLLSVDLQNTPESTVNAPDVWAAILSGIKEMDAHPKEVSEYRKKVMLSLKDKGLTFKSSLSGDYRLVTDQDLNPFNLNQLFERHGKRVAQFLKRHIAVSDAQNDDNSLYQIIEFLKRLQLNKTYINEIEPLLVMLETKLASKDNYWTAQQFNKLLFAMQPKEANIGFPIGLLEAIITEPYSPFNPTSLDELQTGFANEWEAIFDNISTKGGNFSRAMQSNIARLAIRAYQASQNYAFAPQLIQKLSDKKYDGLHNDIITCLINDDAERLDANMDLCDAIVNANPGDQLGETWTATSQLWIRTLIKHPELKAPLVTDALGAISDAKIKALIIHITAWSSFPSDDHPSVPRQDYLKKGAESKAAKLITRLQTLTPEELEALAQCYPKKPAPDTRHLLAFMKKADQRVDPVPFMTSVHELLKVPHERQDYKKLAITRQRDLFRLLEKTRLTQGKETNHLDSKTGITLMLMFQQLREIESGEQLVEGAKKSLTQMNQEELREVFRELSQKTAKEPNNESLSTQLWAVMFEVLGRTTGKYPHLAQQFAFITNDVLLKNARSSILQLKTGEGKSHFVAMRAARHVGTGKKVDVCTAKWSLAARDLLDYKEFFNFLGIKTANIHARSPRDTYESADLVYTTPGDLSLFLDEQASQGNPIVVDPKHRVGLGDEFDFLYYEGQKTQFNYARHTGISPKEMAWFYRSLNKFYDQEIGSKKLKNLSKETLSDCFAYLSEHATEDGLFYLDDLKANPILLLGWLQSAHEAAQLQRDINYTVRFEQVKIGEEEIPLQEIYPLTKDMQAAVGSTFSHGVHQLIAERLNTQAQEKDEPQNYHVHPESDIVSSQVFSQRLKTLWGHWEGFTGTVSSSQAAELHKNYGTEVLRLPTNQKDLRKWPIPEFFNSSDARLEQMANDIKECIKQKKSILFCCATDAEVNEMIESIKPYFEPEVFEEHFLEYTNESHLSPAELLRVKKTKEGLELGQKKRGVVLVAAGFGRGDNVDVETVMICSVHDMNDLGQKGGRTARNGEEGEVLQYYLTQDIDAELENLLTVVDDNNDLKESIDRELRAKGYAPNLLALINAPGEPRQFGLKNSESEDKFKFLLQLREFLLAQDNQLSLVYHEAKARLSSEAIKLIGKLEDPQEREASSKGFARFLHSLEEKWIKILASQKSQQEMVADLNQFILDESNKQLTPLFGEVVEFDPELPLELDFILEDYTVKPLDELQTLRNAIQAELIKVTKVPTDSKKWHRCIESINRMEAEQLNVLLDELKAEESFTFEFLLQLIKPLSEKKAAVKASASVQKSSHRTLEEVYKALPSNDAKTLRTYLLKLSGKTSDAVTDYVRKPGFTELTDHVTHAFPMLRYMTGLGFSQLEAERASYFASPHRRDNLLALPADCFTDLPEVDAEVLDDVKNFVDNFVDIDDAMYPQIFKQLVKGAAVAQTEKSVRLFSKFEPILAATQKPTEILNTLSLLLLGYQKERQLEFFQNLVNKLAGEYKRAAKIKDKQASIVQLNELDKLLNKLLSDQPTTYSSTKTLNKVLLKEGKEAIPSLKDLVLYLDVKTLESSKDFWMNFWPTIGSSKNKNIDLHHQAVAEVQAWYTEYKAHNELTDEHLEIIFGAKHFQSYLLSVYTMPSNGTAAPLNTDLHRLLRLIKHFETSSGIDHLAVLDELAQRFKDYPLAMRKMLELTDRYPEFATEIALSSIAFSAESDIKLDEAANLFYTERMKSANRKFELKKHPHFDGLPKEYKAERVSLMSLLFQGAFIPKFDKPLYPTLLDEEGNEVHVDHYEEQNKAYFESGREAYAEFAQEQVFIPRSTKTRGMTPEQQTKLLESMDELNQIGTSMVNAEQHYTPIAVALPGEIKVCLKNYQNLFFKDKQREIQIQAIMAAMDGIADKNMKNTDDKSANELYMDVLKEITIQKQTLMREDVVKASAQSFPSFHFWGHSRLYKTLNDIEDMVLRTWIDTADTRHSITQYACYVDYYKEQQIEYLNEFKDAIAKWNPNNQYTLFRPSKSIQAIQTLLAGKDDDECIELLKQNKKLIDDLPGTLKAIGHEVLVHAADLPAPGAAAGA